MSKDNLIVQAKEIGERIPKTPRWFSYWVENQYNVDIKRINDRLDKIEVRLDQHDNMFEKMATRMDNHWGKDN
jgi:archaellum component FlaC